MASPSVLVVDDEPNLVKTYTRLLELKGFETCGVVTGGEAITRYQEQPFDLTLVDLQLPDVDGLQVLQALKSCDPAAKVVVITAYDTEENAVRARRLGAAEFLGKPVRVDDLLATVQCLLE
jgi:DNA-binding NtrC family response regulator